MDGNSLTARKDGHLFKKSTQMKKLFTRDLTQTEKQVQVAREILTTIERVSEIGDAKTVAELWDILANLSCSKKEIE